MRVLHSYIRSGVVRNGNGVFFILYTSRGLLLRPVQHIFGRRVCVTFFPVLYRTRKLGSLPSRISMLNSTSGSHFSLFHHFLIGSRASNGVISRRLRPMLSNLIHVQHRISSRLFGVLLRLTTVFHSSDRRHVIRNSTLPCFNLQRLQVPLLRGNVSRFIRLLLIRRLYRLLFRLLQKRIRTTILRLFRLALRTNSLPNSIPSHFFRTIPNRMHLRHHAMTIRRIHMSTPLLHLMRLFLRPPLLHLRSHRPIINLHRHILIHIFLLFHFYTSSHYLHISLLLLLIMLLRVTLMLHRRLLLRQHRIIHSKRIRRHLTRK